MEHGAYRSEDAQARIEELQSELDAARCRAAEADGLRTALYRLRMWHGMSFMAFSTVVAFLCFWGSCRPEPEIRYREIERSCTVEHAVKAEVDEAVRRVLHDQEPAE